MTKLRAVLLGGACLGLISLQASSGSNGRMIADTLKSRIAKLEQLHNDVALTQVAAANEKPGDGTEPPTNDGRGQPAPPPENDPGDTAGLRAKQPAGTVTSASGGVTSYYGTPERKGTPAWAAEAQVFETVTVTEAPAAAAAAPAEAPAAAAAEPPAPAAATPAAAVEAPKVNDLESNPAPAVPGVTWYFGETAHAEDQPFSAPATVYAVAAEPAAAAVFVPAAINYVDSNPGPAVPGVTSYYGESKHAEDQPYSAPAKMVMEAVAAPAAPAPAPAAAAPAAASPVADACRDKLNAVVQAGRILFANGSFDVADGSFRTLDKLAAIAKGCSGVVIEVGGHTDNTGSPPGNDELSRLRAEAVAKYLTRGGVDAAKLKAVGYGQSRPITTNSTPEGRQKNRRIEFLVTGN